MSENAAALFEELTARALEEKDSEEFIGLLLERKEPLAQLAGSQVQLNENTARLWLEREKAVLLRLEEERTKVLVKMEELSKGLKVAKVYNPQCPLPITSVLFDKMG